jgi:hypothetical protein
MVPFLQMTWVTILGGDSVLNPLSSIECVLGLGKAIHLAVIHDLSLLKIQYTLLDCPGDCVDVG